ncbi:MAG: hypothetical protein A2664_00865 [Candidatus Taylorbacteria bacterium RIFCSPHIGHO2_01_FULL_46_22b]|uniref:Uncharacterized protein n=1 Tax=Candidatus Taylorbacteria bacterium RIFCSPHIGHO2_01_FULL_46_22b TaxID=1802301 RepID=A0A1G2M3J9_9BACT|nr:MAG: hypothetical protein A2664_00865 [Candidatus Taylorbacteria bacterium RIFCSPHIGHO2_01_FULL_46_22b]
MQLKTYDGLAVQYPWLEPLILLNLQGVLGDRTLREIVRWKVGFVLIRPDFFSKLDLNSAPQFRNESRTHQEVHELYQTYANTLFLVYFRIGDKDARMAYVDGSDTVGQRIAKIKQWFVGCAAFRGKQLTFERVVKVGKDGNSHSGLNKAIFDIYPFPPDIAHVGHPLTEPVLRTNPHAFAAFREFVNRSAVSATAPRA